MSGGATFSSRFAHGDRVHIDNDSAITAVVIGKCWRSERAEIEISWVHNGAIQTAWIAEWRLSEAEK